MANIVSTGTVTVTNGSVTVTGVNTSFATSLVAGGTLLVAGVTAFIDSFDGENSLKLTKPWPGATAADSEYEIMRVRADVSNVITANDRLADVVRQLQARSFFKADAVGTLVERAAYNDAAKDFVFVVPAAVEGGTPTTYYKLSDASGNWSAGQVFQGPKGDAGNPLAATTAFAELLLGDPDAAAMRARLGVVPTTAFAELLLSDPDAAAMRARLGVVPATAFAELLLSDPDAAAMRARLGAIPTRAEASLLAGHRNRIINGDFDIWQRGNVFNGIANAAFGPDRFKVAYDGSGVVMNISREEFTLGQGDQPPGDHRYWMKVHITNAGTGSTYNSVVQTIEGVETLAGKDVTLTVYLWASSAFTASAFGIRQVFGSGGSPSASVWTSMADGVNVQIGWNKYQFKVTLPSVAGKLRGTNGDDRLEVELYMAPGQAIEYGVSHMSLVEGDATAEPDPFAPRHIAQELALCRRFFEKSSAGTKTSFQGDCTAGGGYTSSNIFFAVPKRASPAIALTNLGSYGFPAAIGSVSVSEDGFLEQRISDVSRTPGYFQSSWTADAEL